MTTFAGCSSDEYAGDPDVVASFKGGVVRRAEFDAFQRLQPEIDDPQVTAVEESDWRVDKIRDIVLRKFLQDEAPDPGVDPAFDFQIQKARAEILRVAMSSELGWDDLRVTSQEIRAEYDAHPDLYYDPPRVRLQHIYLRAEAGVMPEAERQQVRAKLEQIRQQILDGADIAEMAKLHSESSSASGGGWLTLMKDADAFPTFADAVWALKPGEMTEVIDTPTGYHIAKLVEVLPEINRPFEDVVEFCRGRALETKLKEEQAAFVDELGPQYGLEKHYERLDDPAVPVDAALISFQSGDYTFQDLTAELSEAQTGQLYARWLPIVHEFLDKVALNHLLVLEGERRNLEERPGVAKSIEDATQELRYQWSLNQRLNAKAATIGDDVLREYFEQNKQRYQTLRTRDVDVFYLRQERSDLLWKTLKEAEAYRDRILAGEDFADLARAHSEHYSADEGGRLEGVTDYGLSQYVQPRARFGKPFNELKVGEITKPVVAECYDQSRLRYVQTGVIFARLVADHPPVQQEFDAVKEAVRANYLRRHFTEIEAQVKDEVFRIAKIKTYPEHLPPI